MLAAYFPLALLALFVILLQTQKLPPVAKQSSAIDDRRTFYALGCDDFDCFLEK
jgi:hypothetical protein